MRRISVFVVLVITVNFAIGFAPAKADVATCTRVSGASQTENWVKTGNFESLVVNAQWEMQVRGGQSIDMWGPGGQGWWTRVRSGCTTTTQPTRFVLQVLPGRDSSFATVSANIAAALEAVPSNLPAVTRVTLIPPVAGYGCTARASQVQPVAIDAINAHIGPTVDLGPVVMVPTCAMFSDPTGHLTVEGGQYAAREYAARL